MSDSTKKKGLFSWYFNANLLMRINVFDAAVEVLYVIVKWILEYAPIGVFALIAAVFGKQGASVFGSLGMVTLTAYVGSFTV